MASALGKTSHKKSIDEAKHACGTNELCGGLECGIEGAFHAVYSKIQNHEPTSMETDMPTQHPTSPLPYSTSIQTQIKTTMTITKDTQSPTNPINNEQPPTETMDYTDNIPTTIPNDDSTSI